MSVLITYSNGRCKYGRKFAFVRPEMKCANKSRRFDMRNLETGISHHFPNVTYYLIDGLVIGAKNEKFALREFWRVCEKSKVGHVFEAKKIL